MNITHHHFGITASSCGLEEVVKTEEFMHELPFAEGMLAIVLDEVKGVAVNKITKINLTIGRLSGILPACIRYSFEVLSRKTLAEGAALEISQPEAQVHCRNCEADFTSKGLDDLNCPICNMKNIELLSGRDFTVDSIEWQ